jgi:localization factor PodJL
MARAYSQSQPIESEFDRNPNDWQSLRSELMSLLEQVDSQVARVRVPVPPAPAPAPAAEADPRHRDALKSVQRALHRFEEPAPQPVNPRDGLQSAIDQIRARPAAPRVPAPHAAAARPADGAGFDRLAQSVTGLSGRLENLEGEIRAQVKTGANVKDVADQVAQLAHVVELLAGAVGETGQVKRLEGQIASLGRIMSQDREVDLQTLTGRLDDVASTVGRLAELQVHFADRVQNPVETDAFQNGMRAIEDNVRSVYDRIDSLERQRTLRPEDLDHVTATMARFTEALQANADEPRNLVELVDALNTRISDIESGDRLLHGLRKDLGALRDAVTMSLSPRFEAIEQRIDTLGGTLGRQLDGIGERIFERQPDPGVSQLEAQVRQLVARMDQTGEQLSGLARLYNAEPLQIQMPDFDAMAEMVAARAADAVQRQAPDFDAMADRIVTRTAEAVQQQGGSEGALAETINGLESRIAAMLSEMHRAPETDAFDEVQSGIGEVNERLKRLELSLLARRQAAADDASNDADLVALLEDEDVAALPTLEALRPVDAMPRSPAAEAPLNAPPFPEPVATFEDAEFENEAPRGRYDERFSLAARHDDEPAPSPVSEKIEIPPAPQPSAAFLEALNEPAVAPPAPVVSDAATPAQVSATTRNTFIEAARRAAQRQSPSKLRPAAEATTNSLIGRAMSRFQSGEAKSDDKPATRKTYRPEPVVAEPVPEAPAALTTLASIEPQIADIPGATPPRESFLLRNRRTVLLAAAVVAVALLTINLVAQRMNNADAATAEAEPATTGSIATPAALAKSIAPAGDADTMTSSMPPRVIELDDDALSTGSIDKSAAQGFTTSPARAMPAAFTAATALATTTPSVLLPLSSAPSPVKVAPPPEGVGPADLRNAAANGDARAQFEVAAIYTEGRAVPQDYKAAAMWYERAAAQGFAPAQYRIGSLYEAGNGVDKDLDTAKLWYERAAEAGNRMSMHNLAAIYAGGQLGTQQFDAAAKWFEEAAERGLTDSQFNLGMLYARGLGVPQDLEASFKWFGIAALSGDKDAAKARDDIARSLDAESVTRLTAEVNSFHATPADLAANFAPIGTWAKTFDPGETITTHDIVASVQKALGKLGYDVGTPDGVAGKKTADAIKAFEGATGMNQVGLINPRLLAVLGSQPA